MVTKNGTIKPYIVDLAVVYILILLLVLFSCQAAFAKISMKDEVKLGRNAADYMIKSEGLTKDESSQARVKRIGKRIIASLDKSMYPYEFNVLSSSVINACALPGGFIFINQGLVSKFHGDDALAFVISHEVAHSYNRHYAQILAKMERVTLLAITVSAVIGDQQMNVARCAANISAASYSRDNERGADASALQYMCQASYNANGAIEAMKILAEMSSGKGVPKYLASHPSPEHRITLLTAQIDKYDKDLANKPIATGKDQAIEINISEIIGKLPDVSPSTNQYYPLAVGNEWQYKVETAGTSLIYKTCILSSIAVKNGSIYRAETAMGESTKNQYQVFTTKNNLWQRHQLNSVDSPWTIETVLQENNTQSEDDWDYTFNIENELAAPCGLFKDILHVLKRKKEDLSSGFDVWYAKGIGMVKRVNIKTGYQEVLYSYKLSGDNHPSPSEH